MKKQCKYCKKELKPKEYEYPRGIYHQRQKVYNKYCNRVCYLKNNRKIQKQER